MNQISGIVRNPETDKTETEAIVELRDDGGESLYSTKVSGNGSYIFQDIESGSYVVFSAAWGPTKRYYWEIPVAIEADQTIDLNLDANNCETLD